LWLFIAIATIIIVVGGNMGKVVESGKVGLAFGACGFTIFQHEPQHLRHAWLG
jgi:hypothetical protein